VEFDPGVEAANALECLAADGEVAAIEDRPPPEDPLDQHVGGRGHDEIVRADEETPLPVQS
jgi:hypothetical protein